MSDDSRDGGAGDEGGGQEDAGGDDHPDQNGGGGKSNQDEGEGESEQTGGGGPGDEQATSTAEKAAMALSVLFTLSLIAYGGWHMVTTPDGTTPNATVVETESIPSGEVAVTIRLTNPGDVGLVSATVEADCSDLPPSVQFTYVPASSTGEGTLVCPSGTTTPNVSVSNWVTA